jgi:hypothetical protein
MNPHQLLGIIESGCAYGIAVDQKFAGRVIPQDVLRGEGDWTDLVPLTFLASNVGSQYRGAIEADIIGKIP